MRNPEQKNSEKPDTHHVSRLREMASVGLTALRYGGVEYIARQARDGKPIGPALAAFMVADVADGQILDDTPLRRVTDGVVDTAAVVRVMYELGKRYPEARAGIAAVALGQAATGAANAYHLAKTGEVTKGGRYKRAANIATAMLAIIAARGNPRRTRLAGCIAAGVVAATTVPHLRGIGKPTGKKVRRL